MAPPTRAACPQRPAPRTKLGYRQPGLIECCAGAYLLGIAPFLVVIGNTPRKVWTKPVADATYLVR